MTSTETVGFEPTCRLPDNRISSAARYDHFDTSPQALIESVSHYMQNQGTFQEHGRIRFSGNDIMECGKQNEREERA